MNGLAEQGESWYLNRPEWQRHFDVHAPGIWCMAAPSLRSDWQSASRSISSFSPIAWRSTWTGSCRHSPYHLIASSLGAQISVEYAARHQEKVDKLVLICPSGIGGQGAPADHGRGSPQELPGTRGEHVLRWSARASPRIAKYYEQKFASKAWRQALFETVRGTKSHSVLNQLLAIHRPTLVICGQEDRIVDSDAVQDAVQYLPSFEFRMIPRCGHAPQLECPTLVNRMVLEF